MGLDDSIYSRLLKDRIIFLGSDVREDNANAICAQLLLLAAEDPEQDIYLYINSPGGSVNAGHGHLRHDGVHPAGRRHGGDGPGGLDGPVPALARAPRASGTPRLTRGS